MKLLITKTVNKSEYQNPRNIFEKTLPYQSWWSWTGGFSFGVK